MDIEQIRTFCLIYELQGFSKAAVSLHISQPTVSMRIRTLEEELGHKLLDRKNKDIILTPAGESFYQFAKQLLAVADEAKKVLREFSPPSQLSVGATPFGSTYVLPPVLSKVRKQPQFVPVHIRTVPQQHQLIEMFYKGMVDIALLSAATLPKSPNSECLWSEPSVLIAHPEHALVRSPLVQLADLAGNAFVLLAPDHGIEHIGNLMLHLCEEQEITLRLETMVDDLEVVKQLVKQGRCLSLVPLLPVEDDLKQGRLVRIPYDFGRDLSNHIYLFSRISGPHEEFADELRAAIREFALERKEQLGPLAT